MSIVNLHKDHSTVASNTEMSVLNATVKLKKFWWAISLLNYNSYLRCELLYVQPFITTAFLKHMILVVYKHAHHSRHLKCFLLVKVCFWGPIVYRVNNSDIIEPKVKSNWLCLYSAYTKLSVLHSTNNWSRWCLCMC